MARGTEATGRRSPGLAGLLAAGLLGGCATTGPDVARLERQIRELQDQVYLLQKGRQEAESRLARLERQDASSRLAERTVAPAGEPEPAPPGSAGHRARTGLGEPDHRLREPPVRATREAPAAAADADRAFREAKEVFDRTRFAESIPLFEEFLRRYPSDPRAEQAQYLVGEAYYAEGNFPQAVVEFDKVVSAHPDSARAPEALYKAALSYYELGYKESAAKYLDRLARDYPSSAAAVAARPLRSRLRERP